MQSQPRKIKHQALSMFFFFLGVVSFVILKGPLYKSTSSYLTARRSQVSWLYHWPTRVLWWLLLTTALPRKVPVACRVHAEINIESMFLWEHGWYFTTLLGFPIPSSILLAGNMDLMVSQVRRSLVAVIQQYSHIRSVHLPFWAPGHGL